MAARKSYANGVPKIDVDSWRLSEYCDEMRKKYRKDNETLFKETKEYCTKYRCPYGSIGGFLMSMIDKLLNMALSLIYSALDAIMNVFLAVAGVAAQLADAIIIVGCYIVAWSTAGTTCCKKSTILNAIMDFLQKIVNGAEELVKTVIETWYKFMGIMDKLMYTCDCERIEATLQQDYKDALDEAKKTYGNLYDKYVAVMTMPKERQDKTYYLNVRVQSDAVDDFFKRHVKATVSMYNKWPYAATDDCPAAVTSRALAYVSWKQYAYFLVDEWLATTNLWSETNQTGYLPEQHEKQMDYCKSSMPPELYSYVLSLMSDTESADAKAKKEAKIK